MSPALRSIAAVGAIVGLVSAGLALFSYLLVVTLAEADDDGVYG